MSDCKKQRETKQRRLVYDAVMTSCNHPTADEIYQKVRSKDDKVSKGTVYRNLNLLSQNEEVLHVRVQGSDRFDFRLDNHYHIICTKCKKVIDAPLDYIAKYDEAIKKTTGYCIKRHRTVFEGICPECQKNLKSSVLIIQKEGK